MQKDQSWINRAYEKLIAPGTIRFCGYAAMVVFFGFGISAITVAVLLGPGFTIMNNWISDLGNHNFTPVPILFDISFFGSGLLIIPINLYLRKNITPTPRISEVLPASPRMRYRVMGLGFFLMIIGGISMMGLGIFSVDRDFGLHYIFAVLLTSSINLGIILIGLRITIMEQPFVPKPYSYVLGVYGIVVPTIFGVVTPIIFIVLPQFQKLMEWTSYLSTLPWMVTWNLFILRHAETQVKRA